MSAFSEREIALDAFHLARSAPTIPPLGGKQYGIDQEAVLSRRRELFRQAETRCLAALAGPAKFVLREPDDDVLNLMLAAIRRELAPCNDPTS